MTKLQQLEEAMGKLVQATKMVRVRIKWAICAEEHTKYVSGPGGKLAWTYDRKEAEESARAVGGHVVDADKLSSAKWRANHMRRMKKNGCSASCTWPVGVFVEHADDCPRRKCKAVRK